MTVLLDANVLIALLVDDHVHHVVARTGLSASAGASPCPITQGSLMRLLIREGQSAATAQAVLSGATADPRHEFWSDDVEYASVPIEGIIGHRQVTDAYLAQLARPEIPGSPHSTRRWPSCTMTWSTWSGQLTAEGPYPETAKAMWDQLECRVQVTDADQDSAQAPICRPSVELRKVQW